MNSKRLLDHYERIADAPDAIARLRQFVLDLAVRGKLVPQDRNDEPAAELLKRMEKERSRLSKSGENRKSEVGQVAQGEEPFLIPASWVWTRLGSIAEWGSGSTPPRGQLEFYGGDITWLKSGELNDNRALSGSDETVTQLAVDKGSFRLNRPGDVLIAMYGATIGKVAILAEKAVTNQAVCGCTPLAGVFNQFLFTFLLSQRRHFHSMSEGGAQPNISKVKIIWQPFPLPPLAEQYRIVAKVDELMALCDRLEVARAEREASRDRFTASTLGRLSAPDQRTFRDGASSALHELRALTWRADQVKHLRRTVLSLAVRGRLVPQNPNDEPASKLLKRIQMEFARLIETGQLNKPKPFRPIDGCDQLLSLPAGWALARFNQIASIQSNLVDPKLYKSMPHIAPDNIEGWTSRLLPYRSVDEAGVFSGKHLFTAGAILYSKIRPNLAKVVKVDFDGLCSADMYPIHALINRDFLVKFMITMEFVSQAVREDNRVAMPKINQSALSDILVPVPPLAEQHRIVAKVDELMSICDKLEASLATTDETRRRLLEALLTETLALAPEREVAGQRYRQLEAVG